jgi:predicted Rossmann fold nucleotide-binding protein DprA/Smf involved in DNA uptake
MGKISKRVRGIDIVGARTLPSDFRSQVSAVVQYLLDKGDHIHTGGALGADMYALEAVLAHGAYSQALIFSAWSSVVGFPLTVQPLVERYIQHGGKVSWGIVQPYDSRQQVVSGLLSRNKRLVRSVSGLVAFFYGESRGTTGTVLQAIQRGIRVVVFVCGGGVFYRWLLPALGNQLDVRQRVGLGLTLL